MACQYTIQIMANKKRMTKQGTLTPSFENGCTNEIVVRKTVLKSSLWGLNIHIIIILKSDLFLAIGRQFQCTNMYLILTMYAKVTYNPLVLPCLSVIGKSMRNSLSFRCRHVSFHKTKIPSYFLLCHLLCTCITLLFSPLTFYPKTIEIIK